MNEMGYMAQQECGPIESKKGKDVESGLAGASTRKPMGNQKKKKKKREVMI